MNKRGLVGALSVLTFVALGATVVTASAAQATDCKTGSVQITDRPDSGVAGTWALDTFERTYEVCRVVEPTPDPSAVTAKTVEVNSWTYQVKGTDTGTFKTQGAKTPAGASANPLWFPGRTGEFSGTWSLKVEAPAEWQFWAGGYAGNDKSTSEWIAALWSDGDKPVEDFTDWAWTYTLCGKARGWTPHGTRWVNAAKGNSGDITGKYDCAKPEVTFTQATCGEDYKLTPAKLVVKNTKHFSPIWVRFNLNPTKKLLPGGTATHEFTSGKVWLKINGKFVGKYTYDAPVCSSPTPTPTPTVTSTPTPEPTVTTAPPTTAPPTTPPATTEAPVPAGNVGGDGGGLAKTGTPTLLITGGGLVLLLVGAALLVVTQRRRRVINSELTETAVMPRVQ